MAQVLTTQEVFVILDNMEQGESMFDSMCTKQDHENLRQSRRKCKRRYRARMWLKLLSICQGQGELKGSKVWIKWPWKEMMGEERQEAMKGFAVQEQLL